MLTRGDHGHAVAELEHQIRIGDQRRIPTTHFHHLCVHRIGKRHGTDRHARECRPRHEESRDVERAAVAREATGFHAAELLTGSSIAPGSPNSSSTSPASSRIDGSGSVLVCPCRTATSRTPAGRPAMTSATVTPWRSAPSTTSTLVGGAGAGTRRARTPAKTRRCRGWARSHRLDRPRSSRSPASGRRRRRSRPAASACW